MALALLAAYASGTLHLLLVEHAICAEHGELIEGAGQSARVAASGPAAPARPALERAPTPEAHAHDLCLALAGRRDGGPPPTALEDVGALALSPYQFPAADGDAILPSVRLYRLAPKNSPPA